MSSFFEQNSNFPCAFCGRKEECHARNKNWVRKNDEHIIDGYTVSLTACPGFKARECRRKTNFSTNHVPERRGPYLSREDIAIFLRNLTPPVGEIHTTIFMGTNRRIR